MSQKQSPPIQHNYDLSELSPEQALFGSLDGIVATFYTNERPLQGLAGILDWHFHGAISNYLRAGAMSGNKGECAYLPFTLPGQLYHILLVGGGVSPGPGKRQEPDAQTYTTLRQNMLSLKIPRLGISQADFGNASRESLAKNFKEVPLWIVR
jgi:hypothetical protein